MAVWQGIDPSKQVSGAQGRKQIEGYLGRAWTPQDATQAQGILGLGALPQDTDMFSGAQFNQLLQAGAGQTGGTFQAWQPVAPPAPAPTAVAPPPAAPVAAKPALGEYDYPDLALPDAYAPFVAPTAEQAFTDPGYQFSVAEGERALKNMRGAQGILRTGNTAKELIKYGQEAAGNRYADVYDRELQEYNAGLAAYDRAVDASTLEYGAGRDQHADELARDIYNSEAAFRDKTYLSGEQRWQAEMDQRRTEFLSDDEFRRHIYASDDEYRRYRDSIEDAWKRTVLDEERMRFLAELGAR